MSELNSSTFFTFGKYLEIGLNLPEFINTALQSPMEQYFQKNRSRLNSLYLSIDLHSFAFFTIKSLTYLIIWCTMLHTRKHSSIIARRIGLGQGKAYKIWIFRAHKIPNELKSILPACLDCTCMTRFNIY